MMVPQSIYRTTQRQRVKSHQNKMKSPPFLFQAITAALLISNVQNYKMLSDTRRAVLYYHETPPCTTNHHQHTLTSRSPEILHF